MQYLVVIEKTDSGTFGAYVPDLPGCVTVGDTVEETRANIREAIAFHVDGLREEGMPVPPPTASGEMVAVGVGE